jgi:hypothetical protein
MWEITQDVCDANIEAALENTRKVLALAEASGVHVLDVWHHYHAAYACIVAGDLEGAEGHGSSMQSVLVPGQLMNKVFHYLRASFICAAVTQRRSAVRIPGPVTIWDLRWAAPSSASSDDLGCQATTAARQPGARNLADVLGSDLVLLRAARSPIRCFRRARKNSVSRPCGGPSPGGDRI